ncbi:hypothetical protein [Homoserinimonas hongtaonis]|uniref:hypothetical protein n=1 Tax=Homoserinimonas hongtaonis TaxID=2079791 RepID=UPI000D338988|nr:hypothetical protein [Salinibacterium hongtaonis]AWB88937.1 hypothetical protein C2138_04700 [Salinibacterium hongtaonis]
MNYRVIGGHMVQMLVRAFPAPNAIERFTRDADAGIEVPVAAGLDLHERLIERGYSAVKGNHYRLGTGEVAPMVDLLVPGEFGAKNAKHGGRGFDVAPGLTLALAADPVVINVQALLSDHSRHQFTMLVPTVEAAVVMKTLVRQRRLADKDIADLYSLLEVAHAHRDAGFQWELAGDAARRGTRLDAARTLYQLVNAIERGQQVTGSSGVVGFRLAALIRSLVAEPA